MADPRSFPADKMSSQYKDELMRLYNRSKNEQYTVEKPAVPQDIPETQTQGSGQSTNEPSAGISRSEKLEPPNPFAAAGAVSGRRFPMPDPDSFFSNRPQENIHENIPQNAVSEPQERSERTDTVPANATGFVQAEVTTGGSFPVKSAVITVTENVGGRQYIRKILFSDSSGRTEIAELSADAPEGMPYKPYTMRAEASGFYSADNITVPVFPNIKSVQPIDLIPLPEGSRN